MTWEKDDPLLTMPAPLRIGCCLAPKTVPAGW